MTSESPPQTYEVTLAIYDLSNGMARSLSAQFLGPGHTLDLIPHTAILVYGLEYYFGGGAGIDAQDPSHFRQTRNLQPIQYQSLGRTTVSQKEFDAWCLAQGRHLYAPHNYDLLTRNCNHFSHEAARKGLKLEKGTPEWILNVPNQFLASPMGQLIRPMLEQMQVTGPTGEVGSSRFAVVRTVGDEGSASSGVGDSSSTSVRASVSGGTSSTGSRTNDLLQSNPWAHLGDSKTTTSASTSCSSSSSTSISTKSKPPPPPPLKTIETPILSSYRLPLLSNDAKMIPMCLSKLKSANHGDASSSTSTSTTSQFNNLKQILLSSREEEEDPSKLHQAQETLLKILDKDASPSHQVLALMVLRILVLHPQLDITKTSIVEFLFTKLNESSRGMPFRAMAWCTLSNAVGVIKDRSYSVEDLMDVPSMVDAAIREVSTLEEDSQAQIRQSIGSFLYNLVLTMEWNQQDGLPDAIVTMLCGIMENLSLERDHESALRKLLVIGKILTREIPKEEGDHYLKRRNALALTLMKELGFRDEIAQIRKGNEKVLGLASEILALIDKS